MENYLARLEKYIVCDSHPFKFCYRRRLQYVILCPLLFYVECFEGNVWKLSNFVNICFSNQLYLVWKLKKKYEWNKPCILFSDSRSRNFSAVELFSSWSSCCKACIWLSSVSGSFRSRRLSTAKLWSVEQARTTMMRQWMKAIFTTSHLHLSRRIVYLS